MADHRKLLDDIQTKAISGRPSDIGAALRSCLALGGSLGSAELRDWARHELNGYSDGDELPSYRLLGAVVTINAQNMAWQATSMPFPTSSIADPDFRTMFEAPMEMVQPIAELVSMSDGEEKHLRMTRAGASQMMQLIPHLGVLDPSMHVTALWWEMSTSQIHGVISVVAAKLVELTTEISARLAHDTAPAQAGDEAVSFVVNGEGATVNYTGPTSNSSINQAGSSVVDAPKQGVVVSWVQAVAGLIAAATGALAYLAYLEFVQ